MITKPICLKLLWLKRKCPRFDAALEEYLTTSPEMKKLNEDNKQLYELLTNGSGVNITNINAIDDFYATMMVEVCPIIM